MRPPLIAANAVIRATTLTVLRNAPSPPDLGQAAVAPRAGRRREVPPKLSFHIYGDLAAVESDWRRFERRADCTAFQTFDWLASWHRHIGLREGVRLAIIVGRYGDDEIAFIMPLCVTPERLARRLCWLGQELCDYNAPLLATDFPNVSRAKASSLSGGSCRRRCNAIRCSATTGSSLRRCRISSAPKSIHSPICASPRMPAART